MVARSLLDDDVIVARLMDLLKSLRKLPSSAQQLSRLVSACCTALCSCTAYNASA